MRSLVVAHVPGHDESFEIVVESDIRSKTRTSNSTKLRLEILARTYVYVSAYVYPAHLLTPSDHFNVYFGM